MNPSPAVTPIELDQHAFFVGTTGSGKTTRMRLQLEYRLAQIRQYALTPAAYKLVVIDTKPVRFGQSDATGHFADLARKYRGRIVRDWRDIDWASRSVRLWIYRPASELITPAEFSQFFTYVSELKWRTSLGLIALPFLIIIDELVDISADDQSRLRYIHGLAKILSQGRSSWQSIWFLTQKPRWIEGDIRRLTTSRFVFRLPDPDDRDYMARVLGSKLVREVSPSPWGFWYQNELIVETMQQPVYFSGVT